VALVVSEIHDDVKRLSKELFKEDFELAMGGSIFEELLNWYIYSSYEISMHYQENLSYIFFCVVSNINLLA